ncbi:hypothetical protein LEAN103870_09200 [Legionella anisa]|uniref:Uncharacterized protein n=1 Tax=Legionella anisa TaxID=28082 RepID=A0AAX0WYY1_9GAMM|nr:hypothetical protein [Legionella anisa]AWN72818.1 hypothetical protein DLD14_02595 [Legionella anisa]KTC70738.1 hypothetical protein Lani_2285 [Legionella anisa]MCW8423616.1 hypothetical protein [Legionella anisa]MCW8447136.1 hypothetical protein [Legionella anisa]PNL63273.1 hypothetical protein A6J39_019880 [Legionella anisa]
MANKVHLKIQIQDGDYYPQVTEKNKEKYAYVGKLATPRPEPVINSNEQGQTLGGIINMIAEHKKHRAQSHDQWCNTILSMVAAGELTREQLMALYIKFLPIQLKNVISVSDLTQTRQKSAIVGEPQEQEKYTIDLLADSIAAWIVTGQVEPDDLFDQLENQSTMTLR